jgi:hypothetical protein
MSVPGMKGHNANNWTREGADGRLCQPRALAIEALRAETRERLRSRERSPCKARERPSSHTQISRDLWVTDRTRTPLAAGFTCSVLARPMATSDLAKLAARPGPALPPSSNVCGDRHRASFVTVVKVASCARIAAEHSKWCIKFARQPSERFPPSLTTSSRWLSWTEPRSGSFRMSNCPTTRGWRSFRANRTPSRTSGAQLARSKRKSKNSRCSDGAGLRVLA